MALLVALVPVWASASTASAQAGSYTVTGTIRTPTGARNGHNRIVKWIRVIVMDDDLLFDDTMGTGHTNSTGNFSISFTPGFFNDTPDIFINVEYVGTAVSGRFVEVRFVQSDSNPILDTNVEGLIRNDVPPGTLALGTLRTSNNRANIVTEIGDAFRYLQGQFAGYTMPQNMNVEGRTTNGASFVAANGSYASIAQEDYDHPGPGGNSGAAALSDIHHESFHWIAYRSYGNRWPNFNCSANPHSSNKESCEGFAMQEGSAQFFGSASSRSTGIVDQKNGPPAATDWRGADNTGSDNSGEIVEGALELSWNNTADNGGVLQSILGSATDSMNEFRIGYAALRGTTSARMNTFLNASSANGIVYTRGKIDGFDEDDPPNTTPAEDGNFKIIDGKAFVRGTVKPDISLVTRANMPLAANSTTVPANQKDLGHKTAAAGRTDNSTAGFTFIGPVAWASDLSWDTTTIADGDYDVITRTRSDHNWVDNFNPNFAGDSNAATNSNEEWLKTKQTWYNQDATPSNDNEGKIIIDNHAPTVSNFSP